MNMNKDEVISLALIVSAVVVLLGFTCLQVQYCYQNQLLSHYLDDANRILLIGVSKIET